MTLGELIAIGRTARPTKPNPMFPGDDRSGGRDCWSHLRSHGHYHPTIFSAIRQGYLAHPEPYRYVTGSMRLPTPAIGTLQTSMLNRCAGLRSRWKPR